MRPDHEVHEVFSLHERGFSKAEIARRVGVNRATVHDWLTSGLEAVLARPRRIATNRRHQPDECPLVATLDEPAYAYVLGQYLGDGCVSQIGRSYRLRISCCDDYPDIMSETADTIRRTMPGHTVGYVRRPGYTEVYTTSIHWPCLVPHGPGKKHLRSIVLSEWQREIALVRHPAQLLRALIHSDGCRCVNRVRSGGRAYEYPRYLFTNKSDDIQAIYLEACERLGVEARRNNRWSISIAKRQAVARLDELVGPKS